MAKQSHPEGPAKHGEKAVFLRWLPAVAAVLFAAIIALCLIAPRDLNAAQVINVLVVLLIGSVFILCWTAEGKPENKNRS